MLNEMIQHTKYKDFELMPLFHKKFKWLFTLDDLIKGFNVTSLQLQNIIDEHKDILKENIHFIKKESLENKSTENIIYWTKKGIIKLAFFIDTLNSIDFVEFLDELKPPKLDQLDTKNLISIYKAIEKKMMTMATDENQNIDSEQLETMMNTFNKLVHTHNNLMVLEQQHENGSNTQTKSSNNKPLLMDMQEKGYKIADKTAGMAHKFATDTMDTAYKFASKTEDDAFNFASQTENDAFNFTQDTRDAAYNFTMKTEDDAFKFTSKMADDAYHFADKMAENAYHFASKGMDYGYMFTTQGEELGPMADRILWMASEIGLMADRIGEMADRIVHTEHLIINMSFNILNFGLLIDGTIKTISEAGLNALAIAFDREAPKLESSTKHLDLISQNVQTILQQQHEYDMKVLEQQKELRSKTLSALDYIKYDY